MDTRKHSSTSNTVRFALKHSTTGAPLTGLDHTSSGLIISTIADNEATATAYTVAGSNVETISTLGTFATPTASKCRFKEVDSTNHKGLYEFQFANARFSVASAKKLVISVSGATNLLQADYEIQLTANTPHDASEVRDSVFAKAFGSKFNSYTFQQMIQIIAAALGGKASGLDTNAPKYRNFADNGDIISAATDGDGNRSSVTLTPDA